MTISVRVDDQLTGRLRSFQTTRALVSFADSAGPRILTGLRQWAPYRADGKGRHLRDSIRMERATSGTGVTVTFSSDVPQATFVIEGTRAHPIEPKAKSFLSWVGSDGNRVFTRYVNHPGTSPNPFPRHLWEYMQESVAGEFLRTIERELGA